jgi:hypothetical protein
MKAVGEIETMIGQIGRVGALVLGLLSCGCGGLSQEGPLGEPQMEDLKLREVGELYRVHQLMSKKLPRLLKGFIRIGAAASPTAYGAIRSGEVVVRWEATLPDTEVEPSSPTSDEALAYWKTVPDKGGTVLMLDRRLRRMTAEEFKSARPAGTAEPDADKSR